MNLLQNEVFPYYVTPTLHYVLHYAETIVNTGDIASSNCFKSENSYRQYKKNHIACGNAGLNMTRRTLSYKTTLMMKKKYGLREKSVNSKQYAQSIYHTDGEIDGIVKKCVCNWYDELMYYKDPS